MSAAILQRRIEVSDESFGAQKHKQVLDRQTCPWMFQISSQSRVVVCATLICCAPKVLSLYILLEELFGFSLLSTKVRSTIYVLIIKSLNFTC